MLIGLTKLQNALSFVNSYSRLPSEQIDTPDQLQEGLGRKHWLLLLAYCLTLLLTYLGPARTFTAHEGLVIQVAKEMVATGDWLVPRINGMLFLEKFPLHYWTVAGTGLIFGEINETTARLPSVICAFFAILALTWLAGKWYGANKGLLVGLIQSTMVYILTYARLAECDIYLWMVIVLALVVFARNVVTPMPAQWYCGKYSFFVLVGLTQLIKGPFFGAVLIAIPCVGWVILRRDWMALRWLVSIPGWILALTIALIWPTAILWHYPESAEVWWLHTFGRFDPETCIGVRPWWYYLSTIPWQVFPWNLMILVGLPVAFQGIRQRGSRIDSFLFIWFFGMALALSAVTGKHHHYLIHALPPCSFLAMYGLCWLKDRSLEPLMRHAATLLGCLFLAWCAYLGWTWSGQLAFFWWDAAFLGTMIFSLTLVLYQLFAAKKYVLACGILFFMLWTAGMYSQLRLLPLTDNYREDTLLVRRINAVHENEPVIMYKFFPQRELAYLDMPVLHSTHPLQLQEFLANSSTALILTTMANWREINRTIPVSLIDQTPGIRPGHNKQDAHLILLRFSKLPTSARVETSDE